MLYIPRKNMHKNNDNWYNYYNALWTGQLYKLTINKINQIQGLAK